MRSKELVEGSEFTKVLFWRSSGAAGSTKIVFWRCPRATGSTKTLFWRCPGAAGSTKIVFLGFVVGPRLSRVGWTTGGAEL